MAKKKEIDLTPVPHGTEEICFRITNCVMPFGKIVNGKSRIDRSLLTLNQIKILDSLKEDDQMSITMTRDAHNGLRIFIKPKGKRCKPIPVTLHPATYSVCQHVSLGIRLALG